MSDWRSTSPWKLGGIDRATILNAGLADLSTTRADIIKDMALTLIRQHVVSSFDAALEIIAAIAISWGAEGEKEWWKAPYWQDMIEETR